MRKKKERLTTFYLKEIRDKELLDLEIRLTSKWYGAENKKKNKLGGNKHDTR